MLPESKLIRSELTVRELALPEEVMLARKSLVRWLALSLGLIMPNESRKLLLDILDVVLEFHVKRQSPTTRDILARLEETTRAKQNPKAVYYHLLRLKNSGILGRVKGRYHLGSGDNKGLRETFREIYVKRTDTVFSNIGTALEKLESSYR